jgi:hypothetical protein
MNKKRSKTSSSRQSPPRIAGEIGREYDFSKAKPNPYAPRFKTGTTVVVLDPDVAESFPDARSVNAALRSLASGPHRRSSRRVTKGRSP